jgi:hypothetical protein
MSLSRTPCQPQRLDAFWKEELSADQVCLLEEHLSSCELCQSRFEEYLQQQSLIPVLIESRAELQARSSDLPTTKDPSESRVLQDDGLSVNLLPSVSRQRDQLQGMREFAARWFPLNSEHPHSADQVPANGNTPSTKGNLRSQAVRSQANCSGGLSGQEAGGLSGQVALGAIEHFDLLDPIGSGGMGFVYKAYDRRLHRLVALKVLTPTMAATGAARQRFLREAQAAATIVSPHVVPIHAIGQVAELPYLVMSLVDGPDLHRWILQHGPLPLVQSLRIAHQIATGLLAAHRQGIVHRDVKPGNILIQPSIMQASLTDFGLAMVADEASLTNSGLTPGTPSYMSPEQARGETIDARSDWYSLGCVLYTMLVGHPPFRGPHAMAILTRLQNEDPKPPSHYRTELPPWLDRLIMLLLVRDPDLRLTEGPTIARMLSECIQHLEHPSGHSIPAELIEKSPANGRRRILAVAMVVSVLCLFLGGWWFVNKQAIRDAMPTVPETSTTLQNTSADEAEVIQAEAHLQFMSIQAEELEREYQIQQLDRDISSIETGP